MVNLKIEAVIWDVDGTMVNSEPLHIAAWERALAELGFHFSDVSENIKNTMAGKKPDAIAEEMVHDLGLPLEPQKLLERKMLLFLNSVSSDLKPMPGLEVSVPKISKRGFKQAIGTSMTRKYVTIILQKFGLEKYFSAVVTGEEVRKGKPDPETFLLAAEKLILSPERCVVIEDATNGVLAAKAAGSVCIAIKTSEGIPQDLSKADYVISDLREIIAILEA